MARLKHFIIPVVSLVLLAPGVGADWSVVALVSGDLSAGSVTNAIGPGVANADDNRGRGRGRGRRNADKAEKVRGFYRVVVRGFYTGRGKVVVTPGGVKIKADVEDENGRKGTLEANLPVVDNRFQGEGTLMGAKVTLEGRADFADAQGQGQGQGKGVVKVARFVCTFRAADGHFGRISGEHTGAK